MRRLVLLLAALACGLAPIDRPAHWCASACACGCEKGGPCKCDGRTCPAFLLVPETGWILLQVDAENLPKRKAACPDRPLTMGRTWRRSTGGTYWVCNDPECHGCEGENWKFRAPPRPKEH